MRRVGGDSDAEGLHLTYLRVATTAIAPLKHNIIFIDLHKTAGAELQYSMYRKS